MGTLKLGHGHQNLIESCDYLSDTIHKVSLESIVHNAGVTLKLRQRSPKSNHFFPQQCVFVSLVKIHLLLENIECRQDATPTLMLTPTPMGSASKAISYPSSSVGGA